MTFLQLGAEGNIALLDRNMFLSKQTLSTLLRFWVKFERKWSLVLVSHEEYKSEAIISTHFRWYLHIILIIGEIKTKPTFSRTQKLRRTCHYCDYIVISRYHIPGVFSTPSSGSLGCLLARQLCLEDSACNQILQVIPRVCGLELGKTLRPHRREMGGLFLMVSSFPLWAPKSLRYLASLTVLQSTQWLIWPDVSVTCSTPTVTKCQAALRTLQAFPFFKPTCLCKVSRTSPLCLLSFSHSRSQDLTLTAINSKTFSLTIRV